MPLPPLLSCLTQPLLLSDYIDQSLTIGKRELYFSVDRSHIECLLDQETVGRFHQSMTHFNLRPAFLDRPLFLALKTPITLAPGERRSFILERPIALDLNLRRDQHPDHLMIASFPCLKLKRTSYGTVDQAMVCYFWESEQVEEAQSECFALVPVIVVNQSTSTLQLKKLVIYKNYMKLYASSELLCTSAIQVKLNNKREGFINYKSTMPLLFQDQTVTVIEPQKGSRFHIINSFKNFKRRGTGIEHGF